MDTGPLICDSCARLDRDLLATDDDVPATCTAFPFGIPDDIFPGGADHRSSRDGEPTWRLDPERASALKVYEAVRET